jgi:hypothetical protein
MKLSMSYNSLDDEMIKFIVDNIMELGGKDFVYYQFTCPVIGWEAMKTQLGKLDGVGSQYINIAQNTYTGFVVSKT